MAIWHVPDNVVCQTVLVKNPHVSDTTTSASYKYWYQYKFNTIYYGGYFEIVLVVLRVAISGVATLTINSRSLLC